MNDEEKRLVCPLLAALGLDPLTGQDDIRDAVEAAEAEIKRRGKLEEYAMCLEEVLKIDYFHLPRTFASDTPDYASIGRAITAPPSARVAAMLRALGEG